MPIGEKDLEQVAEEIMNEADQDISVDDLTRGTEVYEEVDNEVEEYEDDPQELDLEPPGYESTSSYDYSGAADGYVGEDDY